jgi:hypothetical protein
MTANAISKKQTQAQIPYEVARQIRELLDAARKSYGSQAWDEEAVEDQVIDLVTSDE